MNRLLYWALKFAALAALVLVLAACGYVAWRLFAWLHDNLDLRAIRRAFYSLCTMALFFYAARFMRAHALTGEARARKERQ